MIALSKLIKYQLYTKFITRELLLDKAVSMDHVVFSECASMGPSKVETTVGWERPNNPIEFTTFWVGHDTT